VPTFTVRDRETAVAGIALARTALAVIASSRSTSTATEFEALAGMLTGPGDLHLTRRQGHLLLRATHLLKASIPTTGFGERPGWARAHDVELKAVAACRAASPKPTTTPGA
jgi:hypothetical protein